MNTVFAIPDPVVLPIEGRNEGFPVRNIYCVGRNYWAHRAEMGVSDRDPPFFFAKCLDAIIHCPAGEETTIPYPPETSNLHHEIELVVAIGVQGFRISTDDALDHVFGYAVGLDMTRRDLQGLAKEKGRPWDTGKSFAGAAPVGSIHPAADCGHIEAGRIWLSVNGNSRQDADMEEMIWNVRETIADLSRFHRLQPGDLIFTGTPAGVGAVSPGDRLQGGAEGVGEIAVAIAE